MDVYDLHYDESKEDGYWHGIIFVPVKNIDRLSGYLKEAREDYNFPYPLHFTKLRKNESINSPRTLLTESYISIGIASIQQQKFQKNPPKARIGRHLKIIGDIGSKFVVYRVVCDDRSLDRENAIEQTLKSALKGALHFLFDGSRSIAVRRVVFEGAELQGIDDESILRNLRGQTRSYIKRLPTNFIAQSSDHTKLQRGQDTDDSYTLQLCDALLGGVRFAVVKNGEHPARSRVSKPLGELLKYADQPHVRMKQSRYYKGFSLAQAEMKNGNWNFSNLHIREKEVGSRQINLL